jgi:uncharacterized lipoprotein YmbA
MRTGYLLLLSTAMLGGCASVPKAASNALAVDKPLVLVSEQQGRRQETYVDRPRLKEVRSVTLPNAGLQLPEASTKINQQQVDLLSNALNRNLCNRLGQYFAVKTGTEPADLQLQLTLTGITPTSRAASGISAAADVFVPGPFRIPVGMGALALDIKASQGGQTAAFMRWAKGANPVLNGASVSSIADAYDLLDLFSREFTELLVEDENNQPGRPKLPEADIETNQTLCTTNFGKASLIGKGASFILPLAPELIDQGKPEATEPSLEGQ